MSTCSAITNALANKGKDNAWLAGQTGLSATRVDAILSGSSKATTQEFNSIASALGLGANAQHAAKVTG